MNTKSFLNYTRITSYINLLFTIYVVYNFIIFFSFCFLKDVPIISEAFDLLEEASGDSVVGGYMVIGGIAGLFLGVMGLMAAFFMMILFGFLTIIFVPCSLYSFKLLKLQKKNSDVSILYPRYKMDTVHKLIIHYAIFAICLYLTFSIRAVPMMIFAIPSLIIIILCHKLRKMIKLQVAQ